MWNCLVHQGWASKVVWLDVIAVCVSYETPPGVSVASSRFLVVKSFSVVLLLA